MVRVERSGRDKVRREEKTVKGERRDRRGRQ